MRVLAARHVGGPEQLEELELPDAPLRSEQVRIAVTAIGTNLAEIVQLSGDFQIPAPEPLVPGFELTGVICEVLPGATHSFQVGDRVIALVSWGGYTDTLVADAAHVLPIPDGMDDLTAAAFPVAFATAHVSLSHRGRLTPGETAIITGVTGNVGAAALQVARAIGATTIAVDRSGTLPVDAADHVVPATGVAAAVNAITSGRGADLALDLIGGGLTDQLLSALAWEGRLVTTGFASGDIPRVNLLDVLVRNVAILGEDIAGYAHRQPEVARAALQQCLQWQIDGLIDPVAAQSRAFSAASAIAALTEVAAGTSRCKLALVVKS